MKSKFKLKLSSNFKKNLISNLSFKNIIKISLSYFSIKLILTQISKKSDYELIFSNTKLNNYLTKSILPIDYTPTIYMPGCLLQMLYNETSVSYQEVKYHRQYVATNDLGVVS